MKRADLADRVRELELEVARLNGVIEGMRLAPPVQPYTPLLPWQWPQTTEPLPNPITNPRITWGTTTGDQCLDDAICVYPGGRYQ